MARLTPKILEPKDFPLTVPPGTLLISNTYRGNDEFPTSYARNIEGEVCMSDLTNFVNELQQIDFVDVRPPLVITKVIKQGQNIMIYWIVGNIS